MLHLRLELAKDYDVVTGTGYYEGAQSPSTGLKDRVAFSTHLESEHSMPVTGEWLTSGTSKQPFIGAVRVNYDNPNVNDPIAAKAQLEKIDANINYALEQAHLLPYFPGIDSVPHLPKRQTHGGGIDDEPSSFDESGTKYYNQYDDQGNFIGYTWDALDGSSGADIYTNGMLTKSIWIDSNSISYETSYGYKNGVISDTAWSSTEGVQGTWTYNPNGSSIGNVTYADKSGYSYSNDGNDYVEVKNFDSTGKITEFDWSKADGSYGSSVLNSDGTLTSTVTTADGTITTTTSEPSALQNLISGFNTSETGQAIATYTPAIIDALSLVKAIQSGEPLPTVSSGLRLANDISIINKNPNYVLSGAASAASGVLSLMSLDAALKRGDGWAIASSSAYTISFAATSYAQFATGSSLLKAGELSTEMTNIYGATAGGALNTLNEALPYLNLALSIKNGDNVGVAVAVVEIALSKFVAAYTVPYIGWAYAIYSIADSLFGGHDIPDPWGTGRFVWDGTAVTYQSAGETGGNEAVSGMMQSILSTMNTMIDMERTANPNFPLGLIPNRMPSIAYDMSGYRYTDIDPLTGEELHPSLRFDTSGKPYNATQDSPESFISLGEAIVRSALSRGAIAPMWEVYTAQMQTLAGDPKAGLTEEARAGRDGQLAGEITGDTQTFRPIVLDLNGDGIHVIDKSVSMVNFDIDNSGFLKQSAWIEGDDAFLTLDRNFNGVIDSGKEMFSNSTVALGRRGLAGMSYVNNFIEIRRVG